MLRYETVLNFERFWTTDCMEKQTDMLGLKLALTTNRSKYIRLLFAEATIGKALNNQINVKETFTANLKSF